MTSSIENWKDGKTEEGGASFPKPDLSLAKVGDYFYSDGTYSTILSSTKEVVGIVFWKGDPTATDLALKRDFPQCTHGLVVSLKETQSAWQSDYDSQSSIQSWAETQEFYTSGGYKALNKEVDLGNSEDIQGYNNTQILKAYNEAFAGSYPVTILDCFSEVTGDGTLPMV